jgi:hypothetical protein
MPNSSFVFDIDSLGASAVLLLTFALVLVLAGVLFWIGVVGWALGLLQRAIQLSVGTGFQVWQKLLAWAGWPQILLLVIGLLAVSLPWGASTAVRPLGGGLTLLFLGVTTCLAYLFIDLERYDVARGYKALHKPLTGQELAANLARYGPQVGMPLLIVASVGVVAGFALLNLGLYQSVGQHWYQLQDNDAARTAAAPGYLDFLAYTLVNLLGVVDLLHVASSYKYVHVTY